MLTKENLYILAIAGLGIKDEVIERNLANNRGSIALGSYGVLKEWRASQSSYQVAYTKMSEALTLNGMNDCKFEALM